MNKTLSNMMKKLIYQTFERQLKNPQKLKIAFKNKKK